MNKIFMKIIIILMLTFGLLFAEVDQKDILLKEANKFSLRRQYEKAISIYTELQQEYPEDTEIAEKLINIYVLTSQLEKAEEILSDYRTVFPELDYTRLRISLLLAKSEVKQAEKECRKFIKGNAGKLNNYKTFASLFQRYRQYDFAIEILNLARETAQDEHLYTSDMANNYYQISDYKNSITEYLKHVVKNKSYKNYVLNKLKMILKEDSLQIAAIRDFSEGSDNDNIQEIYAVCLGEIGDISSALEVYSDLNMEKLLTYAETLKKTGNSEKALQAYSKYLEKVGSPELVANAELSIAQIYMNQERYQEAEVLLVNIYNSEELKERTYRFKTKANRISRELLADLALLNEQYDQVVTYLTEAKEFSYNQNEKKTIDFKLIHFRIMQNELDTANRHLSELIINEDTASDIYKKGYYYSFLLAVMQNDASSDSLLSELLINLPGDDQVNDAIELSLILNQLQPDTRVQFLTAYRNRQLYKFSTAIALLEELNLATANEQILILAAEWALQSGDLEKAADLFNRQYIDEDLTQYALLMLVNISEGIENPLQIAEDFLAVNPKSIFSPAFRNFLAEK
jgi:tetratricopeptide (TPR) repeat protein